MSGALEQACADLLLHSRDPVTGSCAACGDPAPCPDAWAAARLLAAHPRRLPFRLEVLAPWLGGSAAPAGSAPGRPWPEKAQRRWRWEGVVDAVRAVAGVTERRASRSRRSGEW